MTLYNFTSGVWDGSTNPKLSVALNNMFADGYRIQLLNTISQLQDRSITFSADGGLFAEAYVDSTGRNDSINSTDTDAIFLSDRYVPYATLTTTGSSEATGNWLVSSSKTSVTITVTAISNTIVDTIRVGSNDTGTVTVIVKKDGETIASKSVSGPDSSDAVITFTSSDFTDVFETTSTNTITVTHSGANDLLSTSGSYSGTLFNVSAQTVFGTYSGNSLSLIECSAVYEDSVVVHDIPTGTFSDTFQTSFLTAKVVDLEEGSNIQYKLTNATEDTGYVDYNEILKASSAFTSEPTKLYVKLVPKTTSPTAGTPSISGVGIIGDR